VKSEVAGIEGTTSVHEATQSRVKMRASTKVKSDVGKAIVDGDGHRGKHRTGEMGVSRKGFTI
jgi:hypothetical protein